MKRRNTKREAKSDWQWLKRYRVWDANRKIFAYPENWIEPEQRVPAALRASLLGIAAVICPDCYIKTKRKRVPKPAQLRGVRLLFLSKNREGRVGGRAVTRGGVRQGSLSGRSARGGL